MSDVPSIEELRQRYVLPAGISLETIIHARWITGHHAPNGTDELLGWLLLCVDVCTKQQEKIELLEQKRDTLVELARSMCSSLDTEGVETEACQEFERLYPVSD